MKLKSLLLATFSLLLVFCSCKTHKPLATTHTERIEQHVMPIPVSADTIEITLYQTLEKQRGLDTSDERSDPQYKTSVASQNNSTFLISHSSLRSTRPLTLQTTHTDSSMRIKLTLRPDTIFVPYINHIRSDTIVVPDRVCQQKLNHSNMTNLFLILILIAMLMLAVRRAKLV